MNRPRILFVLWRLFRGGGVPIVTRAFLRHFDRSSFDVHVCTVRPIHTEDAPASLGDGITYHALGISGQPSAGLRLRAMRGIREVVRRVQPDILHLHSGTASYAALAAAGRHRGVLEVHDAPQAGRMSPVNRRFERILVKRLGFTPMVHSRAVLEATADAWRIEPWRFRLVPLGVDTEAFAPDPDRRVPTRAALGVPADAPVVSYVARIVPEKRPELFLAADHIQLDGQVVIGGAQRAAVAEARHQPFPAGASDPPPASFPDVCRAARAVGCREGAGLRAPPARDRAPRHQAGQHLTPPLYSVMDIVAFPSYREGFPNVPLEAAAMGLPVVATRVTGCVDAVVDGETGRLVPVRDAARLAEAIQGYLQDGERRHRHGLEGRQRVLRDFRPEAIWAGIHEIYSELLAWRRPATDRESSGFTRAMTVPRPNG